MQPVTKQDRQRERAPLEWKTEATFTRGRVIAQIQVADGQRGKLYSVRFGRENPKSPERLTPFLEPKDIDQLRFVTEQADAYLKEMAVDALCDRFRKAR